MIDLAPFKDFFYAVTIGMVRIGSMINVFPLIGDQSFPGLIRNVLMFSLSLIVFPTIVYNVPGDMSILQTVVIIFKEIFIGILIGFVTGIPFWIASAVGYFIDNQRGASMGELFDPTISSEGSVFGNILTKVMAALFFVTGAYIAFFEVLYTSFQVWPVYNLLPPLQLKLPGYFLHLMDYMMRQAVLMASPFMILMFLMDFGLGLANRFAPQMNVFSLGFPIKSAVALFVIVFYIATLGNLFSQEFLQSFQVVQYLNKLFIS